MVTITFLIAYIAAWTVLSASSTRTLPHGMEETSATAVGPTWAISRYTSWRMSTWINCDTGKDNPALASHGYSAEYIQEQLSGRVKPTPDLNRPDPVPKDFVVPIPPPARFGFSKVWRAEFKTLDLPRLTLILGEISEGRGKSIHVYLAYVSISETDKRLCSGSNSPPT